MKTGKFLLWAFLGLAIGLLLLSRQTARLITDWQWFSALGFGAVFQTRLLVQALTVGAAAVAAGAFVNLNLALALRRTRGAPLLFPAQSPTGVVAVRYSEPMLRWIAFGISLGAAALVGLLAAEVWQEVLLAWHGADTGLRDPIFGFDLSFYLFLLPLVPWFKSMLWLTGLITLFLTALIYVLRREVLLVQQDGVLVPGGVRFAGLGSPARTHLGLLLGGALLALAVGFFLDRYRLLLDQSGLFAGPGFAQIHGELPLLLLATIATLVAAVLVFVATRRARLRPAVWGMGMIGLCWLLLVGIPPLIQRLLVDPNELVREQPYLAHNIAATNVAFGIDKISERLLSGEAGLDRAALDRNGTTLINIPIWDRGPLLEAFEQLQEIRTYYDFFSVDNDRYEIDGELRQIMLSPRELNTLSLPNRTWINEALTFTHGYGLTAGPVNQVSEEGLPVLFVKDLPPRSAKASLEIDRPEIYFGEVASDHAFVATNTREFDYPSGDENIFTSYQGQGDMPVGGLLRRALLALRLGNIKVLLATDFTDRSRVQLHRQIRERVETLAPFLSFDRDPYLVIADRRLVWVLDGYVFSHNYPYSQAIGRRFNYMRNPVKVTIDAYEGATTFYLLDPGEPIIRAWAQAFPTLFKPMEQMPESIRRHLRAPEDLFTVQAQVFATYHMREPAIFYNKEDQWQVPLVGQTQMQPHYIVMKLPGEQREEFILMLPFTPRSKDNLAAWIVARCDPAHLGQLVAYRFPKQKLIFGPRQVEARINQDPEISRLVSLWDQRGSKVFWGNLQVIPVEESLLYIQPLYLKAENGKIPELKRVIVGYQNQIAMDLTLDLALERIFGRSGQPSGAAASPDPAAAGPAAESAGHDTGATEAGVAEVQASGVAGAPVAMPASSSREAVPPPTSAFAPPGEDGTMTMAEQAWQHYQKAEIAARSGEWAVYGEEIRVLGELLRKMAQRRPTTHRERNPSELSPP